MRVDCQTGSRGGINLWQLLQQQVTENQLGNKMALFDDERKEAVSFNALIADAEGIAAQLQAEGVQPGTLLVSQLIAARVNPFVLLHRECPRRI